MIIGILSDTHGSISGWNGALEIFKRESVDLILHCGDILEPFAPPSSPLRCALNVSPVPLLAVQGNMDTPNDIAQLDFPVVPLALIQDGSTRIVAVHGNALTDQHAAYRQAKVLGAEFLVRGHTHSPHMERLREVYVLNPGSAGQLRGRDLRATVMVLSPVNVRLFAIPSGEIIKELTF